MNTATFAIICDIFEPLQRLWAFNFEKKKHTKLPWRQRQLALLESERVSQASWHDGGVHAAL